MFPAGIAGWLVSFAVLGEASAMRALLVSFLYFAPLAAAMVTWPAVVQVSNGRWAGEYERLALAGIGFAPFALAALGVLWIAADWWTPWAGRTFPQGHWLSVNAVFARNMAAQTVFWALAWRRQRRAQMERGKKAATTLLVAYGAAFSLLGYDLVMGLNPAWHSSLFGAYFFVSGMYAGVAAWALLAAMSPDPDPERLHDLGKLVVTFCLITTYCLYSQLLPIWYENLPFETAFAVKRLNFEPGLAVGAALLAAAYLGPVLFLLTAKAKRNPKILGSVCGVILAALWVERWWLAGLELPGNPLFGLVDASAGLMLLGLFGVGIARRLRMGAP